MNLRRLAVAATLLSTLGGANSWAQQPAERQPEAAAAPAPQGQPPASPSATGVTRAGSPASAPSERADAYYNFTMGHVYEQQYENTSKAEYATQAIEFYKKAYALDPKSPVIGERLAEMYWKAQRVRDAVAEAQEILKRDPNDVPTRRLLARIYLRSLGNLSENGGQSEIAARGIEQSEARVFDAGCRRRLPPHRSNLPRVAPARSCRRESAESPPVCAGQPGGDV